MAGCRGPAARGRRHAEHAEPDAVLAVLREPNARDHQCARTNGPGAPGESVPNPIEEREWSFCVEPRSRSCLP